MCTANCFSLLFESKQDFLEHVTAKKLEKNCGIVAFSFKQQEEVFDENSNACNEFLLEQRQLLTQIRFLKEEAE